jgi:hypothetical protein
MRSVAVASNETAEVSGGARFADILAATDLLGLAPVTGTCGTVDAGAPAQFGELHSERFLTKPFVTQAPHRRGTYRP